MQHQAEGRSDFFTVMDDFLCLRSPFSGIIYIYERSIYNNNFFRSDSALSVVAVYCLRVYTNP